MDTKNLKGFAQSTRRSLLDQVSSKLGFVIKPESPARRESPQTVKELERIIAEVGEEALVDRVAYIWFNRFCALRFMDVNGYNRVGVVSPTKGQVQPEILAEAKAGHIDGSIVGTRSSARVNGLLNGSILSQDAQAEAYRLLIVSVCNDLSRSMPFLFEQIDDYTELLMPEDLLSPTSILAELRKAMTEDACADVEIIGWLYQFYISEKKDQVFAGLKNNVKITAENIPAATQLFTPHWIVRYLVENSLGRLWLLNRPQSKLAAQMDYYIAPEEPETDFLKLSRPEDIRICDPACGSGHMLTYAFDLLHAIYAEEGYEADRIPALILTHNLHGVEIDDRAGALAAFALVMKAAARLGRRKFLRLGVQPNICVMQDVRFTSAEMQDVAAVVGRDLFTDALRETLGQFEAAKNFGSLIVPKLRDPAEVARRVAAKDFSGDLLLRDVQERVLKVLEMAEAISPKYHVAVANPPYMGSRGMNAEMTDWSKKAYPDSRADLFSMFMERSLALTTNHGFMAMVNMQAWMFLSTFEKLREKLLKRASIVSMAHLGTRAFDTIGGEVVSTTAFVFENDGKPAVTGTYLRLVEGENEGAKSEAAKQAAMGKRPQSVFCVPSAHFAKIPGSPIAYWVHSEFASFFEGESIGQITEFSGSQNITASNETFVRNWHEVVSSKVMHKWRPYAKGGEFRKHYGNLWWVVDWSPQARDHYKNTPTGNLLSEKLWYRKGITYTDITTRGFASRYLPEGCIYDKAGPAFHPDETLIDPLLAYLNTSAVNYALSVLNPTIHCQVRDVKALPVPPLSSELSISGNRLRTLSQSDWDACETSWDFTTLPLLAPEHRDQTLAGSYTNLRAHWQGMTSEMQRLEEENNRIFIDAYGLQDELTPEVPLAEITLTCNPAYRYGGKASVDELETRLRADTMAEFLHYAVGCMFGRYSLDAPGLILANQGEALADYLARVPEPTFMPDEHNVIPMIDFEGDWFEDDITELFKQFLRVTFGDQHFVENLAFIEGALGKDIQKYFLKDFYNDHVRRFKKRPIYWLFSSARGTFNALIYMHRYHADTVSLVLNEYLREFRTKLEARKGNYEQVSISASSSQKDKTQALKLIEKINKAIDEVNEYEREVLFSLAGERIQIDLDDGVKRNYPLFGNALKKITGL